MFAIVVGNGGGGGGGGGSGDGGGGGGDGGGGGFDYNDGIEEDSSGCNHIGNMLMIA